MPSHEIVSLIGDLEELSALPIFDPDYESIRKNGSELLGIDFDGTISEYKYGWNGGRVPYSESPVPGAFDFIDQAVKEFNVIIFSARCNHPHGRQSIKDWFVYHGLPLGVREQLIYMPGKPPLFCLIDDRAVEFDGRWDRLPSPTKLRENFKPWYYAHREKA